MNNKHELPTEQEIRNLTTLDKNSLKWYFEGNNFIDISTIPKNIVYTYMLSNDIISLEDTLGKKLDIASVKYFISGSMVLDFHNYHTHIKSLIEKEVKSDNEFYEIRDYYLKLQLLKNRNNP